MTERQFRATLKKLAKVKREAKKRREAAKKPAEQAPHAAGAWYRCPKCGTAANFTTFCTMCREPMQPDNRKRGA